MSQNLITGDEIIADILLGFSEAQEILASHGIACAGCHVNEYETLRDGVVAHYGADIFERVLADLNEAAAEAPDFTLKPKPAPILSKAAREVLLKIQIENDQKHWGLKIDALNNLGDINYYLDLQAKPDPGDKVFNSEGMALFCSKESEMLLRGKIINYVVTDQDEGFKFENA